MAARPQGIFRPSAPAPPHFRLAARRMSPDPEIQRRLLDLEESLCHDQRLIEELNQVVIDLRGHVDQLEKRLRRAESRLQVVDQRLQDSEEDLPHEKPPHY